MQRYSDGLAVPKLMIDTFPGKTTGTGADAGKVWCELTYTPKDTDHIIVPPIISVGGLCVSAEFFAISGKTLEMWIFKDTYDKADTPTQSVNSGAAGGDPHNHAITYTQTDVCPLLLDNQALNTIRVHYTVA